MSRLIARAAGDHNEFFDLQPGIGARPSRQPREIIDGIGRCTVEDAVVAFEHFGPKRY